MTKSRAKPSEHVLVHLLVHANLGDPGEKEMTRDRSVRVRVRVRMKKTVIFRQSVWKYLFGYRLDTRVQVRIPSVLPGFLTA